MKHQSQHISRYITSLPCLGGRWGRVRYELPGWRDYGVRARHLQQTSLAHPQNPVVAAQRQTAPCQGAIKWGANSGRERPSAGTQPRARYIGVTPPRGIREASRGPISGPDHESPGLGRVQRSSRLGNATYPQQSQLDIDAIEKRPRQSVLVAPDRL